MNIHATERRYSTGVEGYRSACETILFQRAAHSANVTAISTLMKIQMYVGPLIVYTCLNHFALTQTHTQNATALTSMLSPFRFDQPVGGIGEGTKKKERNYPLDIVGIGSHWESATKNHEWVPLRSEFQAIGTVPFKKWLTPMLIQSLFCSCGLLGAVAYRAKRAVHI